MSSMPAGAPFCLRTCTLSAVRWLTQHWLPYHVATICSGTTRTRSGSASASSPPRARSGKKATYPSAGGTRWTTCPSICRSSLRRSASRWSSATQRMRFSSSAIQTMSRGSIADRARTSRRSGSAAGATCSGARRRWAAMPQRSRQSQRTRPELQRRGDTSSCALSMACGRRARLLPGLLLCTHRIPRCEAHLGAARVCAL